MKSIVVFIGLALLSSPAAAQPKKSPLAWKKTVLDTKFRSEGVAIADVNKDGKPDLLAGDVWYEAPDWKMHVIRVDRAFDGAKGYSQSFAVFADDIDGDGFPDQIVVGFPGAPCHWYKNPGKTNAKWTEHQINDNACNETPIYADVIGNGKRALILGHRREMCFFMPGKDVAKPWERVSVSGKHADPKKDMPGTHMFSHGLGVTDLDGDGKNDILCMDGWWQQPAKPDGSPWKFTAWALPKCADMYAFDVDGDGKNDVIATSAHNTGFWWFQQRPDATFVKRDFFPVPAELAKVPVDVKLAKEEAALYGEVSKLRASEKKVAWRLSPELCELARTDNAAAYKGAIRVTMSGSPELVHKALGDYLAKHKHPGLEVGVGVRKDGKLALLVGDRGNFALPGQTHALHFVDIDGDGVKDLVTGRRFWAHGPGGDDHPGDPAFLYWFRGVKDSEGLRSYIPYPIDDDSGIGTQFAIDDLDGDGKPDIAISNKKGVFVFVQMQAAKE